MDELILASGSPRRRELLKRIFRDFRVVPSGVDEEALDKSDPVLFAVAAAEAKARDVGARFLEAIVIGADTVVNLGAEIFGKPRDEAEARRMLERLAGRTHRVITGLAVYRKRDERIVTGHEISRVTFRPIAEAEIEAYLRTRGHEDKAGSYAIQDVGETFIAKLQGDYDNVVGLPVARLKRLLREFRAPERSVRIERQSLPDGWGRAKAEGRTISVPDTVVGDEARVREVKRRKRTYGRLIRIEAPSPFRVKAECPHFGVCGGCAFQDLAYGKQLEAKDEYLRRTLQGAGIDFEGAKIEPIRPSPDAFGYRGKMEYAFGGAGDGLYLGLRERASPLHKPRRRAVPLRVCPIFSDTAGPVFEAALGWARPAGRPAYDFVRQAGFFRNLVLREAKASGELMAVLVTASGEPGPDAGPFGTRLMAEIAGMRSVWRARTDRVADLVEYGALEHLAGEPFVEERIGGRRFRIRPETFFQPNPRGAEVLYDELGKEAEAARPRRILGLYSGSGSIEIALADAAEEVVGVDVSAANVAAAEENARLNGAGNVRFLAGSVEEVLAKGRFDGFDLLVLDPPRAGISAAGMKLLLRLEIPRIAYISCGPASLARDLGVLQRRAGYRLARVAGFDFFPHTPHLEALAVLEK